MIHDFASTSMLVSQPGRTATLEPYSFRLAYGAGGMTERSPATTHTSIRGDDGPVDVRSCSMATASAGRSEPAHSSSTFIAQKAEGEPPPMLEHRDLTGQIFRGDRATPPDRTRLLESIDVS